jgi:hypothetical protein
MSTHSIPSVEDIPFDVSPSTRALLVDILSHLATVEEENRQKDDEITALREEIALERAYDRQRLARLEAPAPTLSQKTAQDHLDKLFSEMKRLSIRQTTTKDAARLLGVSKPLIDKIKPYLAADYRFVIMRDPRHKQRHLIRLSGT